MLRMPQIGDSASLTKTFTETDVRSFASLVGDNNPIHLDQAYASQTRFGRCIVHGMLTAGLISAVFSEKLPGPGTIYLSQTLRFKAPVYLNDTITARVEVVDIRLDKPIVTFRTICENQQGTTVLEGESVMLVPALGETPGQ